MNDPNQPVYLYEKTVQYLAKEILSHLNTPNYRLPTEIELANLQNVSRITATKAYKVIEEMGLIVRIKGKGTFISPDATEQMLAPLITTEQAPTEKKIGVIVPLTSSLHVLKILAGIIEGTSKYQLAVASSDMSMEKEQALIQQFTKSGAQGLIIYPIDNDIYNNTLLSLMLKDFPVVMVDRYLNGLNFNYISSDHERMIRDGLDHLIRNGNRNILFFNANIKTNSSLIQRREHYINILRENGINKTFFYSFDGTQDATSEIFVKPFRQYLDDNPDLTAIITADFASSMHLMKIMKVLGLHAPDRYEIVYLDLYDDNFENFFEHPTFIEQDSFKIGTEAAKMISRHIETPSLPKEKNVIPIRLIEGSTTKNN